MVSSQVGQWFRRLRVRQKIALGYGLSLGVAIAGTALGVGLADAQQRRAEALGQDALEELKLLTRFQVDALEVFIQQDYVEEALSQPDRISAVYLEWRKHFHRFHRSWQEFSATENNTVGEEAVESDEELAALEDFFDQHRQALDQYVQLFEPLASTTSPPYTPALGDRFRANLEALQQQAFQQQTYQINEDLTALTVIIREEYEVAQEAINRVSALRLWWIGLTLAISVAIASLLSILISGAIAHPIRTLTQMTQQLSQGQVDVRIPNPGDDELGQLGGAFNQMAAQLAESGLLTQQIQHLQQTLGDLKKNQAKLIHAEKMSSLGQLVAGVAHEINTPLGAIQSSIGNITDALQRTLRDLPPLLQTLPPDQLTAFFTLLDWTRQSQEILSSREERQLKRQIQQTLRDGDLPQADLIADTLSKMGIAADLTPIMPLLRSPDSPALLGTAYQLAVVQNNSQNIHLAIGQATRIVYALKNYVRQDVVGAPILASVAEGIDTVLTLYQNQIKRGITIEKTYASLPPLLCYPEELAQVWSNLINNAIQAMNYRGTLAIATSEQNQHIVVQLTDTGSGIPPEIQPQIFDPFFTTKARGEGTGLGLSIVKSIIDKHHGHIEVESAPGHTIFRVWLPLKPA